MLRIPVPTSSGSCLVLPDNSQLHGYQISFQDCVQGEVRYLGKKHELLYLLREAECGGAIAARLAWEQEKLSILRHRCLPELAETFESAGHSYLVLKFPEGECLERAFSQEIVVDWALALYDLLLFLGRSGVHLDLSPAQVLKQRDGTIRLIDLRNAERSPDHPARPLESPLSGATDLAGLGKCLYFWLCGTPGHPEAPRLNTLKSSTVSPGVSDLVDQLLRGKFEGGPEDFKRLCAVRAPATASAETVSPRVPLEGVPGITCLAPGTQIANYRLEFHVRSGMSLTYLGKRGSTIRFIKEVNCQDSSPAAALRKEFEVLQTLRHPRIIKAHQLVESNGYLYLFLDYVESKNLASFIDKSGPGPVEEKRLLDWGLQLCDVLSYLHTLKPTVIYRDLKPANILLSRDGKLLLSDFGLARFHKVGQARDTEALGTFATSSPEHFTGQTDARSDIYSLGATLYLLATKGFKPSSPFSFPPIRSVNPALSAEFEALVRSCLHEDPQRRYGDVATLAKEIKRIQESLVVSEPATKSPPSTTANRLQSESAHTASSDLVKNWLSRWSPNAPLDPARVQLHKGTHKLALWSRQLAVMLDSGVPLSRALEVLSGQIEDPLMEKILIDVHQRVERGASLSEAMARYPRVFSKIAIGLVHSGESTGAFTQALFRLADVLERQSGLQQRLGAAFVYPAFVILVTVVLTLFVFYTILPNFIIIFREQNIQLPLITRILVIITDSVRNPGIWCMSAGLGIFVSAIVKRMLATEQGTLILYQLALSLPLIGSSLQYAGLARFCWVLESMVGSGIDLLKSVRMASSASGSPILRNDCQNLCESIRVGDPMSTHIKHNPEIYPPLMSHMLKAGEESNGHQEMLGRLATWFNLEMESRLDLLSAAIEPVLMGVVATIVGTIVIGIFLPLYALMGNMGG